ncbi:hypothetical protein Tco_1337145 [Tanacetum coccineum]
MVPPLMAVIYNHHTHPLVAAVVVVYNDVRVAVLGMPWGGSGRGDGDGVDSGVDVVGCRGAMVARGGE